ncbi:AAA family ATPase [bacterium]|nr:AAA family ATPase [bacterium]
MKKECRNIFMLGRPGCGKSELYRRLSPSLKKEGFAQEFVRVDDFPKLWNIFVNDKDFKRCRPTEDGGYKVTDSKVWDDILREVNRDIKKLDRKGKIIFIEFSRPNYAHSLKNFDRKILDKSLIIYIDCSFETCWKRNVRRHKAALTAGLDNHLVSREEMEETYLHDDKDELVRFGEESEIPIVVVDTDYEGMAHYKGIIEKIIKTLKKFGREK